MATEVYKDAHFTINSVDLSDHVESLTLSFDSESVDDTAMGDDDRNYLVGLNDGTISVTFKQDFAAGETDATLWSIYDGQAAVAFAIRKSDTDSTGATNPEYQGNCVLTNYTALTGSVGDSMTAPANFQITGSKTRATS